MSQKLIPEDLAGIQQVVFGNLQRGDLVVSGPNRTKEWAPESMFGWIINGDRRVIVPPTNIPHHSPIPDVTVYRPIPVPTHRLSSAGLPQNPEQCAGASTKLSNPKDLIGSDKLPLHLWPTTASALGCLALLDGALKYGRSNFRFVGVRASIYYDALVRHLNAWFEGEDDDPDSGLPHLAHVLACAAILVEAKAAGKLTDDRVIPARYREFVDSLTAHVARLKLKHKDRDPKHYTIADAVLTTLNER